MAGSNRSRSIRIVRSNGRETGDPPSCPLWATADYRCDFQQIGGHSRLVVFRAHQPLYVEACEGPDAGYRRAVTLRERLESGLTLVPDRPEPVDDSSTSTPALRLADSGLGEAAPALEPAVVRTDLAGIIVEANEAAARLLNIGRHGMRPRKFLWFFLHARDALLAAQRAAAMGETCTVDTTVRPADRRPVIVSMKVTRVDDELQWTLSRSTGGR